MREYRFLATEETQESLRLARGVWHGVTIEELSVTIHLVTGEAVRVEPEAGTVVWPNGADLDPDVLYAEVTGVPVADRLNRPQAS